MLRSTTHFILGSNRVFLDGFDGVCQLCEFEPKSYQAGLFADFQIDFPGKLSRASAQRCAEFLAGRLAARVALHSLNKPAAQIPIAEDRAPVWPLGLSGSISHSGNKAVCALSGDGGMVGIDLQQWLSLDTSEQIESMILNAGERALVKAGFADYAEGVTIAFSAKEAVYKALYPQVKKRFDFLDIEIVKVNVQQHCLELNLADVAPGLGKLATLKWLKSAEDVLSYTPQRFLSNAVA